MNIAILGEGAAGMYCGSCLRDNALASALRRAGHQVTLVPLYTPMRTDEPSAAEEQVYYGGLNAYLQFASGFFRHTPRVVDWLLDRPWLLRKAGEYGAQTHPGKLVDFTLSILKGEQGHTVKELRRLVRFLKADAKRPDIVTLPNAMFIGLAALLRRELGCKIVCELTGEDIFLEAMPEPGRSQVRQQIQARCADIDTFIATSHYYARHMAEYLAIPEAKIAVVHSGVAEGHILSEPPKRPAGRPPTVGYFARICPEKGADRILEIFGELRRLHGMSDVRLRIAGYLGSGQRKWWEEKFSAAVGEGLAGSVEFLGDVGC